MRKKSVTKSIIKSITVGAMTFMLVVIFSGCSAIKARIENNTDTGTQTSETESEGTAYVEPGVLTEVEYSYSSGTMMGMDFGIIVTQSEIVSLFYFDEEDHTQKDVTHIPITSDQWKQIEDAVSVITPDLKETEPQDEGTNLITKHMMQDGGDRTSFALTWENNGKTIHVDYATPHNDEYLHLLDILKGMTKNDKKADDNKIGNPKKKDDNKDLDYDEEKDEEKDIVSEYLIEYCDYRRLFPDDVKDFTPEQLRIARNEIYARHGRRFDDAKLQAYFDEKSWYHGTIEPDQFDESCLNEYEIANINFLKLLEPVEAKDNLPDAPYLSILNQYGFDCGYSVLSFEIDNDNFKDCGGYYEVNAIFGQAIEAPGDLKIGDQVTLEFNHITGETHTLTYMESGLFEKDTLDRLAEISENDEDPFYFPDYYYTPSIDGSPVTLYHDSDDRMDKPVYQGIFYIRKDATTESFPTYEMNPVLNRNIQGKEYLRCNFCNMVVFDSKGYAVRLSYLGD